MYIRELEIDGFGTLGGGERCSFEAPVTVVYGPNEAGKSTLLRFIRSMLFGFANRSQPAERGEPVYGGRHGGRIVLTDAGRLYVLERYGDVAVRRGGPAVLLREESGAEWRLTQAELEQRLLGGVSERLFRQLFAVTLDELQELRMLAAEEVGNYLYHAGMAGGAALTAANKALEAERDKLFKPNGVQPELNKLLAKLRGLEAELKRLRSGEGEFNEATRELEALERELHAAEAEVPALRSRVAIVQGASDAREWWLRLQAIALEEAELSNQLPDPQAEPLPEDAAARWDKLLGEREQADRQLQAAAAELDGLRRQREALSWNEVLLSRLPEIEALEERREASAARAGELSELTADRRMLEETLAGLLARLSPDWGTADLQAFAALAEKEQARTLQSAMAGKERELERLEAEQRRLTRQLAALEEDQRHTTMTDPAPAASNGLREAAALVEGGFMAGDRAGLRAGWQRLEDELRVRDRAKLAMSLAEADAAGEAAPRSGRTRAQRQNGDGAVLLRPSAAAIAALGLAAAVLPLLLKLDGAARTALFAMAAVLLLAAGGVLLAGRAWSKRSAVGGGRSQAEAAETAERLREARAALDAAERGVTAAARALLRQPEQASAALLGGGTADSEAARRELREAVDRELDRLETAERSRIAQQDQERRRAEWTREREQLERERKELAAGHKALQGKWLVWLQERKLPAGLPPELLPELFQLAEQALQTQRQLARLHGRAAQLQAELAAFEAAAAPLLALAPPHAAAPAGAGAALAVKLLHREALQQREQAAEAARLQERLRQAEAAAQAARAAREAADAAVRAALGAAGDDGEAAYERRLRVDERRRALQRERRETALRLAAGRDASGLAELEALLARHDEAALALLLREAQETLRLREQQLAELLDSRGRAAQRLERLRQEAETEERQVAFEELNAEFERLADRYALLSVTAELIRRTKSFFEEERQPEVLLQASEYFEEMTEGAYARIVAPAEAETLLAETKDRRSLDASLLSRGTREQLYLALRFALAGAASPAQALPLLLDDLFVHFDAGRLKRTAHVLGRVALERQVVLFTCHEHVVRAIADALPDAGVLRIARRAGAGGVSGPSPSGTAIPG